MKYLLILAIAFTGCVHNPFNLKESEFILKNNLPAHRVKAELPLTTYHTLIGDNSLSAYSQAIDLINESAGCKIFKKPVHTFNKISNGVHLKCWNRIADPDFLGDMAEPEDETSGLCISDINEKNAHINHSIVFIPCYRPFPEVQLRIAVHELLHAVGLGHDRELGTIMYRSHKFSDFEFQEADLNILRGYYCGNKKLQEVDVR